MENQNLKEAIQNRYYGGSVLPGEINLILKAVEKDAIESKTDAKSMACEFASWLCKEGYSYQISFFKYLNVISMTWHEKSELFDLFMEERNK